MKFIFDESTQLQLVYDIGFKITLTDLQRVKMFRRYTIHGFDFFYTSNGTTGRVYVQVGMNKFYIAYYEYGRGYWFIYDVLELSDYSKRIVSKIIT